MPNGRCKIPAIFAVAAISECLIYAEAKYCAFEIHGEPKYYVCPRTEYCCNFGCCVSPGFQIYHLWYYWLLVIIMFLVCSGGGWWYRYWLQGRYRPSTSTVPPRTSSSRAQSALRGPTCRAQQARVTYNPARNTVLLHRMWKGPQRNTTPPAYNGAAASSAQFQNTNVVLNDNNCPYYELYGPPPSYETVIAQTRGKIMSPTTLENSRTNAQTSPSIQSHNVAHCFSHNSYGSLPTRIHIDNGIAERRNSCGSNLEESAANGESYQSFGYKNLSQKCEGQQVIQRLGGNGGAPLQDNFYQESTASGTRPAVPQNVLKKLPFCSQQESRTEPIDQDAAVSLHSSKSSPDTFTIIGGNGSADYNSSGASASGQFPQNVMMNRGIEDVNVCREAEGQNFGELEVEIMETEKPSDENHKRLDPKSSRSPKLFMFSKGEEGLGSRYNRAQSSSLKGTRSGGMQWSESRERYCDVHIYKESSAKDNKRRIEDSPASSSTTSGYSRSKKSNSSCDECIAQSVGSNSEQNPSNNVILPISPNPNVQINSLITTPINIIENYQHYPPINITSPAQLIRSTSTNIESENKLGRSKSLD